MPDHINQIVSGQVQPAFVQVAALCLRSGPDGAEVLLVKTLRTGGWVIPKGWPMTGKTLSQAAALEAWEEAGAKGHIAPNPIGSFTYTKIRKSGLPVQCRAHVFLMKTTQTLDVYPEALKREKQWMTLGQAAKLVRDPELSDLMAKLADYPPEGF